MTIPNEVLVVDDVDATREMTALILQRAGFEVSVAHSGAEALRAALEHKPDLIVSDVVMPEMDGAELCRQVRAEPRLHGTLVLLSSGASVTSHEQARGLEAGADGYVALPISNRELVARVRALMRIKAAEDERDLLIGELKGALGDVKLLSGILPICSHCRKIRNDSGYWDQLETFIQSHSAAQFSHGICPECLAKQGDADT